jgi:cell wall-associated NlpC family hydrolase
LHVRTVGALFCSLIATGSSASAALAANTGGASASEKTATSTPTTPASTAPKIHLFRVTSRSRSVVYKGPVYIKSASGAVVPYVAGSAPTSTGTAASATGGAAASGAQPSPASSAIPPELMTGSGMTSATGPVARPELLVPGSTARYVNGLAAAPINAPAAVQQIIWAGNEMIGLPYIFGGGHASFTSRGYDCSGTVSFALHGASLLSSPEDSSEFESWGSHGAGRWVAIFANPGHAYMTVAGLRLDTSAADDPSGQQGPRWRPLRSGNQGYTVRHPLGL